SVGNASQAAGLVYAIKGDGPRAIALTERNLAISTASGRAPSPAGKAFLGHAKTLVGQPDEAIALLEQSLADAAVARFLPCTSLWTGWLAGAYLQAGRLDEARATGERAVEMARNHHEHGFEGMALRELGDAVAAGDVPDVERAEQLYRQALAI